LLPYNFTTLTPFVSNTPQAQTATPCPLVQKRKKENQPLSNSLPTLNSEEPKRKKQSYGPRRSTADKLAAIFDAIRDVNWTLGEFLYHTFQTKDKDGQDMKRSHQHSKYATHFLQGQTAYTPGIILECWYHSPDGRVHGGSGQEVSMYATTPVYTKIKPARAALTAFAAQIVEKKLVQEARKAVQPQSGLHATSKKRGTQKVEWADVGASTVSHVEAVIKRHQPLTWRLLNRIAGEKDVEGVPAVQKRRPTSMARHLTLMSSYLNSIDYACRSVHMLSQVLTSHETTRRACSHLPVVFIVHLTEYELNIIPHIGAQYAVVTARFEAKYIANIIQYLPLAKCCSSSYQRYCFPSEKRQTRP